MHKITLVSFLQTEAQKWMCLLQRLLKINDNLNRLIVNRIDFYSHFNVSRMC